MTPQLPSREEFDRLHLTSAPGDYYGIEFPMSVAMLRDFGTDFLTRAFRASGVIAADNEVTAITQLDAIEVPGASERALLGVSYLRQEPGLHEQLFAKFPPVEPDFKFELARMGDGEVVMQRLSQSVDLPVDVPKYYFGDHSAKTTNFILITERIAFGQDPIEPAWKKGYDHQLSDVDAHYDVLARSLARLVAAHKSGALGPQIEAIFPPGAAARDFHPIPDAEARVDRLIDFVSRIAPQLFIDEARDPQFLAVWRDDLLFGLAHKDAVNAWLHADPQYTGLCHPNLNVDNAWFWREADGTLKAGLIDWGGAGQMSIAQALSSMMMMPEPQNYKQLVDLVLASFNDELAVQGQPQLDPDELKFRFKASLYSTALGTIVGIIIDYFGAFPEEEWTSMESRFDPRLLDSGLATIVIWIDNMLREWLEDLTPGAACRQIVARSSGVNRAKP